MCQCKGEDKCMYHLMGMDCNVTIEEDVDIYVWAQEWVDYVNDLPCTLDDIPNH